MDIVDILFLGLVLVAFFAFSVTVMWVLHDDVRNRRRREALVHNSNDGAVPHARAA
ncbi:MAG: hypothetical protein JNN22_15160 [Rhodospirillales bacterium]|nr:hypothetical protein [Rhodospirillales bacterium]